MNALSLTASDEVIDKRLSRQLYGFPDESVEIDDKGKNFLGLPTTNKTKISGNGRGLVGGKNFFHLASDIFDSMRDEGRFPTSFNEAGELFGLKRDWLKTEEPFESGFFDTAAACFYDAWLYYQWLLDQPKGKNLGEGFRYFFTASVKHPEWRRALEASWKNSYKVKGGNYHEIAPPTLEFLFDSSRTKQIWNFGSAKRPNTEGLKRASDSYCFLCDLIEADNDKKSSLIQEGLPHITYASLHGDTLFFESLGRALSIPFEPQPSLPLAEFSSLPLKKESGKKSWARRLWLSRGLWLLDLHILQQSPMDLSISEARTLSGNPYSKAKTANRNEGLFRASQLFASGAKDNGRQIYLTLTESGKAQLPEFAESGLPWKIVTADIE